MKTYREKKKCKLMRSKLFNYIEKKGVKLTGQKQGLTSVVKAIRKNLPVLVVG